MNKKDLRDHLFDRVDWDPSPTPQAVRMVDRFIQRGVDQLALDAPFLFHEGSVRIATQPDVEPASDNDQLLLVGFDDLDGSEVNPWVFYTILAAGHADATPWKDDRSWDGRTLVLTDDDGVEHALQIRSIWLQEPDGKGVSTARYLISVMRPWSWETYGPGPFAWRVTTPAYWLPDDVIQIKDVRLLGTPGRIEVIGQTEAEDAGFVDDLEPGARAEGQPVFAFRREHFQLPGPNVAPAIQVAELPAETTDPDLVWKGPEPPGEFEYKITYTWGKRDTDHQNVGPARWDTQGEHYTEPDGSVPLTESRWAASRMREPLWESAPSPAASAENPPVPYAAVREASGVVRIKVPNVEYQTGMGMVGSTGLLNTAFRRYTTGHSGIQVRIWRRRISADFSAYDQLNAMPGVEITGLTKLDIQDHFYLLAEMRVDEHNGGVFVDDGSILPDMSRPLRDVHGYQSMRFWPPPDQRYEVEVRCVRRPRPLVSDSDVPQIHAEACELVITWAKALLYEKVRDYGAMQASKEEYRGLLETATRRYGDLRPPNRPVRKNFATPPGYTRRTHRWWKRGTDP